MNLEIEETMKSLIPIFARIQEEQKVKLHGDWNTGLSQMVELALKIKGIPYKYVAERQWVIRHNAEPIVVVYDGKPSVTEYLIVLEYNDETYTSVPRLVHNGRPILGSLFILEYIDETWTNLPRLLPTDSYETAQIRFWAKYVREQVFKNLMISTIKYGEEREKGRKELAENLKVLEEGIEEIYSGHIPAFDSKTPKYLNITLIGLLGPFQNFGKVTDPKLIGPEKNPLICSLLSSLAELPEVKECMSLVSMYEAIIAGMPTPF